ncbi:MAG TPA: NAD(P)-dependent oxidoreductase [bacterium]|nr:NAD(P)-dependent oxidoreductase [bacterium]
MKVLVTGAAGVVGSHVVRQLLSERGVGVVAADLLPTPGPMLAAVEGYEYRRLDVTDLAQVLETFTNVRPERVVHLAAVVGDWYNRYPRANHEVNLGGTLNMFEACRLSAVPRIVFASTWSMYPDFRGTPHGHPRYEPVPESTSPMPVRPYEIVKYACERLAAWYGQLYDLEFAALRFGGYYAAERRFQIEPRGGGALSDMVAAAAAGRAFRLEAGGDQGFDAVHVKDCAHGCVRAVLARETPSRVYNIGTGEVTTLDEAASVLRRLVPGCDLAVGPGLLGIKHYCRLDISRARAELGYAPRFSLEEGLRDCLADLRRAAAG